MFKLTQLISLITVFFCASILFSTAVYSAKVDPTGPFGHRGSSSQMATEKKLILESIIHGDGIHTVVINGKVMKPNDTIGEYKLTAVNDKSVVLRSDTQRIKLHVFKENIVNVSVIK
ncbi:hypothetical protein A9Q74_15510 [Colwellia sp. 39_35_sub15_T18]|nr:hypothetical protein A9Q74_15510 [Colwellia sp. 39_35_sub15_T18]